MSLNVVAAPEGTLGFDCDNPISRRAADLLSRANYKFALRYVPRVKPHLNDLTASEAIVILQAGLGLMPVQHVEPGTWIPSAQKGTDYGRVAVQHCKDCGISPGTMCWLDLEEVADIPHSIIIAYCNNWHSIVGHGGFTPGLYIGDGARLTADELYYNLRFEHYWAAYNLNKDHYPAVRGVQMRQGSARSPLGVEFAIDTDMTHVDKKGGSPLVLVQDGWLE